MPNYFKDKVSGYYIYFTSKCIVEAMHAHANNKGPIPSGSAKFWVYEDGTSKLVEKGVCPLSKKDIAEIQNHIYLNFERMKTMWAEFACDGDESKIEFRRNR